MRRAIVLAASLLISACASYSGSGLLVGVAGFDDVVATMGVPQMQWQDPDGSRQLAYPRGPAGFHTFMVRLGANGKLRSIENVLDELHLARVDVGMSKEQVLRLLGPPDQRLTVYSRARDELAWDWRFQSRLSEPMRMMVLFDATSGKVRSTMMQIEHESTIDAAPGP